MKFYIIAGEASGDLHASNLVKAMKLVQNASTEFILSEAEALPEKPGQVSMTHQFRGFGGDLMKNAGVELLKHYRETAFMGFWEVIKNLRTILGYIDLCKKDILEWKPDAIILVDYPGFNLRIAEFAHQQHFKVFYYISPQVWAWKSSRVKKIKRDVDKMFVILPFEKDFYQKWGYDVEFVGHPLLDEIKSQAGSEKSQVGSNVILSTSASLSINSVEGNKSEVENLKPVIALLPGSRKQEIATMLPIMLTVMNDFPDHRFVIAAVRSVEEKFYYSLIGNKNCELIFDQTYSLLSVAKAALVTSGTATMETALFNVPQIVCYKGSRLSYFIARRLVDVKYIAMVNLILDRPLVKELIQQDLNTLNLKTELQKILFDEAARKEIEEGYKELKEKLGGSGASEKVARKILEYVATDYTHR